MNNHLIVFLAFSEVDIIKKSFESIINPSFDYFIVENKSENSKIISKYFINQKSIFNNIKGYIQFKENISATAIDCFLKDFDILIKQYEYVTITDGDFFMFNFKDAMVEVINAFNNPKCFVSSVSLYLANNYGDNSNRLIGTEYYIKDQNNRASIPYGNIQGITSNCFLTFKTSNMEFLKQIHYVDTHIYSKIHTIDGIWLKTNKNQAYHLTWDLYIDGNPYYEWKKKVIGVIWDKMPEIGYIKYF
jgi:hypothetical protein